MADRFDGGGTKRGKAALDAATTTENKNKALEP